MSSVKPVIYGDRHFWAFDVALGVFLKQLIEVASSWPDHQCESWLEPAIQQWRVGAVVGDMAISLDDHGWSADQLRTVLAMMNAACEALATRIEISAEELAAVPVLDGQPIETRGYDPVPTKPAIELGRAIMQLLDGALPKEPDGKSWCWGFPQGVVLFDCRRPSDLKD